ncbi:uncharacterized protein LOC115409683 [Salarias fasciatus]|uniref:uncharacterized protein LOC115409683 n=1 Tax=Salarias fasciatus TaxID=181472 RepID=UPI001176EA7F|nr:uncharacterized protein LOC115409683 [Salarias fasciatus]
MLQGAASRAGLCLSYCLLFNIWLSAPDVESAGPLHTFTLEQQPGQPDLEDWEWGSGSSLLHLLHSFPADSPFVTESPGKPVNCTQRFWLPPSSPICWENIAGPREFAQSRLLVLQNRAALQAVSSSSGVEESGLSYDRLAREEMEGIRSDHQNMSETIQTMETVFVSLSEKRKEGKEQGALTSMKRNFASTRDAIDSRADMAAHLEKQFSSLENTLLNIHFRLIKLIRQ